MNETPVVAGIGPGAEFAANAKQSGQQRSLEQSAPMIVDLILKTGITDRVGATASRNDTAVVYGHSELDRLTQSLPFPESASAIVIENSRC